MILLDEAAVPSEDKTARRVCMAWIVLIVSGVLEAVWATALSRSEGFTKIVPTFIFLVALIASMVGLAYAMRSIPVGVAYAVWVGIGALLTAGYAIISGVEPLSIMKVVFLLIIIAGIIGLKIVSD